MRRALALGCAGVVVGITACSGSSDGTASGTEPYRVVVAAPLTSQPWVGESVRRGAQLAIDEINDRDGVGDDHRRLALSVYDVGGTGTCCPGEPGPALPTVATSAGPAVPVLRHTW